MNRAEVLDRVIRTLEDEISTIERDKDEQVAELRRQIVRLREEGRKEAPPQLAVQSGEFAGMSPGEAIHAYLSARPGVAVSVRQLTEDLAAGRLEMLAKVKAGNGGRSLAKERIRLVRIALGNNKHWLVINEDEDTVRLGVGQPFRRKKKVVK